MSNLAINAERLWGELMETAAIGGTAEGRHLPADADRSRPPGARLVQARAPRRSAARVTVDDMGAMFARRDGQRATCRRSPSAAISTPSRPAASSTACSACSARSRRCARCIEAGYETYAPIEVVNWTNEEGSRFAPGDGGVRRVRRRVRRATGRRRAGPRRHDVRRGAGRDRLSRRRSAAASIRCRRSSSCTSSRGRSWRPRARTSASSPACRAMRWYEVTRDRAGRAHRRDADAPAQERAARRGAR